MSITEEYLNYLFFKSGLVNIDIAKRSERLTELRKGETYKPQRNGEFTPMKQKILEYEGPENREALLAELTKDDREITGIESSQFLDDPDYVEKMSNSGLGFYMESFVSYYGKCPGCGQVSLKKFRNCSIPAVDFVCINKEFHEKHNICILFQLKISISESHDYFYTSADGNKFINIGSRRYGEIPHSIKGSSSLDLKKLAIGYICLKLITKEDGTYQINPALSFCVYPNLQLLHDKQYYNYPGPVSSGHNPIIVDMSMMNNILIESIFTEGIVVGTPFVEQTISNPYDLVSKKIDFSDAAMGKSGGYYYKYMKYKSKYLKLKEII
jgi:hypothetical protein